MPDVPLYGTLLFYAERSAVLLCGTPFFYAERSAVPLCGTLFFYAERLDQPAKMAKIAKMARPPTVEIKGDPHSGK